MPDCMILGLTDSEMELTEEQMDGWQCAMQLSALGYEPVHSKIYPLFSAISCQSIKG